MSNGFVISHRSHLLSISFQRELSNQIGYFYHGPQCKRSIRSFEQLMFLYFIFSFGDIIWVRINRLAFYRYRSSHYFFYYFKKILLIVKVIFEGRTVNKLVLQDI